jgi:DnaJ like chaperone protein
MLWNEKRKLKQILNSLKNIFYVVAMADGKLSKQEEKYLKRVMYEYARAVNLDKNLAQSLKKEEIKNVSKEKIELYLKNLKPLFEKDKSLKNKLFLALVEFSLIDGLNEDKKEILEEIVDELGLEIDDIEEYIAKNFYQQQTQQNDKKEDYYEVLGVGRNVSCNELKKKYRELVKKYHPDKISSKGLDEEFVKFAEEKFKKVTEAYEFLTKMKNCK